jgi:hypothetical protein
MTGITIRDYTPELIELARGSEGGNAVYEWEKLTTKQKQKDS